ncbi:MAG: LysR family transcriptional regulator [Pseudomonadota bacterium]
MDTSTKRLGCVLLNFSLKQLEAFVWVADLASFGGAAERLNTTQPNISSRIAALETALDVKLLERQAGVVELTPKGRELLRHVREVLRATEQLRDAADQASLYDGVLKLGVTELIVHTWLRDYLKALKEKYPEVLVELTVDLSVNLTAALQSRTIDLALQSGPFAESAPGAAALGCYPWIWVASPAIADKATSQSLTAEQIARHPILTHARKTGPYQQVRDHFAGIRGVRLVPSSNLAACLQMTVDTMGIAVLPMAMVQRELQDGRLVQLDYAWSPPDLCFEARYSHPHVSTVVIEAASMARDVAVQCCGDSARWHTQQ